jgi:hypothetical protein
VGVLDAASGAKLDTLFAFQGRLISVAPLPGGAVLFAADAQPPAVWLPGQDRSYALAVGGHAVAASADGGRLLALAREELTRIKPGSYKIVEQLKLDDAAWLAGPADLSFAAVASRGGTRVTVCGVEPLKAAVQRVVQDSPITCLAASPDGAWVATGGEDGVLRLFDRELRRVGSLEAGGAPRFAAFSRDGSTLGVGVGGKIRLYRKKG